MVFQLFLGSGRVKSANFQDFWEFWLRNHPEHLAYIYIYHIWRLFEVFSPKKSDFLRFLRSRTSKVLKFDWFYKRLASGAGKVIFCEISRNFHFFTEFRPEVLKCVVFYKGLARRAEMWNFNDFHEFSLFPTRRLSKRCFFYWFYNAWGHAGDRMAEKLENHEFSWFSCFSLKSQRRIPCVLAYIYIYITFGGFWNATCQKSDFPAVSLFFAHFCSISQNVL